MSESEKPTAKSARGAKRGEKSAPSRNTGKKLSTVDAKTAAAKSAFLRALLTDDVFTVLAASRKTGTEPTTHYRWIKNDPEYAQAVEDALELITQRLEQKAGERAAGIGVKQPSDILMMFLLNGRRPDVYRPQAKGEFRGKGGEVVKFTLSLGDGGAL